MRSYLIAAGIVVGLLFGHPTHALAQRRAPTSLLSTQRLGLACRLAGGNLETQLNCWLDHHPDVVEAMAYFGPDYAGGTPFTWPSWPPAIKKQFLQDFNDMVLWYGAGMPRRYPQLFPMPIPEGGPHQPPYPGGYTPAFWMTESMGMQVYLALAANSLAAELTAAFPWSIATYTQDELKMLLFQNDYMYWSWDAATQGYFFQGRADAPAVPGFIVSFFNTKHLIGADATDTVARFYEWERVLWHFFTPSSAADFWGPIAPPVPDQVVIKGRVYSGPVQGIGFGHFTAACGGTSIFTKSVLRAMNIPVEVHALKCQHTLPTFPTLGLAWSHGDDPYDQLGWITPLPGVASPKTQDYFIKIADLDTLFPPGQDDFTCDHTTGIQVVNVAIQFGSDELMDLYCQDVASGADHASGKVYDLLDWFYPLETLESMGLWTTLANKAAITNYCQP